MTTAMIHSYRERLLKTLSAHDTYEIMRELGQPATDKQSALDCRYWLLANWNSDIRNRVFTVIKRNT
jgi:hypothetical protein